MKNKKGDAVKDSERYTISRILQECEILERDHDPDDWPPIQMRDVSDLCRAVKEQIPVLDRLEERLNAGYIISKKDEHWHILDSKGGSVCRGKSIREMLVNLIFIECRDGYEI